MSTQSPRIRFNGEIARRLGLSAFLLALVSGTAAQAPTAETSTSQTPSSTAPKGSGFTMRVLSNFELGTRRHAAGDIKMAISIFQQGANAGEPKSMFALGTYYLYGEGVAKDLSRAFSLFTSAAKLGSAESAYLLFLMQARGNTTELNKEQGLTYLRSAAVGCIPQAQNDMAKLFYEGKLVPKDRMNGIEWLAIAADHEEKETKDTVQKIKQALSPSDLERVRSLEKEHRASLKCE